MSSNNFTQIVEEKIFRIPSELYDPLENTISLDFFGFIDCYLKMLVRNMQDHRPTFNQINSRYDENDNKKHLEKSEDMIRNIIALQMRHYFTTVNVDPFNNGKVDIKIDNFGNCPEVALIECLRWDTYRTKYKSKICQALKYLNGQTVCYLLTFVQNRDDISKSFASAWQQTKKWDQDCTIKDKRCNDSNCIYNIFASEHKYKERKLVINHYFFDFKWENFKEK